MRVAREGTDREGCLDSRGQKAHSAMTLAIRPGQRFGTLTAIKFTRRGEQRGWSARCDCGALKFVTSNALARGRTRSCGCSRKSRAGEALTAERLREALSYNPETGLFTRRIRCGRIAPGEIAGTIALNGYITISLDGRRYYAHRLAWLYVHGEWPQKLYHTNRDRADNRIANLRESTHAHNSANAKNRGRPTKAAALDHLIA